MSSLLVIGGEMSCEFFAGNAIISLGLHFAQVPLLHPFDLKYGEAFDLLAHEAIITQLIMAGLLVLVHFGTPCQSCTWARSPQCRSWEHPMGMPGLDPKNQALVDAGDVLI